MNLHSADSIPVAAPKEISAVRNWSTSKEATSECSEAAVSSRSISKISQ